MHCLPFVLSLVITLLASALGAQTTDYTAADRRAYLERRADSLTWDSAMFAGDLEWRTELRGVGPLPNGVFPVPQYSLNGEHGFGGALSMGNIQRPDTIAGRLLVHQSFGLGNYPDEAAAADDRYTIFCTIAAVVDTLTREGSASTKSIISSRNNPDVVAQGYMETTVGRISYVAFITADGHRYALVNMRLFDLRFGDVIVIVPHRDGSLRSLQLTAPVRGREDNSKVLEALFRDSQDLKERLKDDDVISHRVPDR